MYCNKGPAYPRERWSLEVPLDWSQTEAKELSLCALTLTTHWLQVVFGEQARPLGRLLPQPRAIPGEGFSCQLSAANSLGSWGSEFPALKGIIWCCITTSIEVTSCISRTNLFLMKNLSYLGTDLLKFWSASFPRKMYNSKFNVTNYSSH